MSETKLQDWQLVIDAAQPYLETAAREELDNTVNLVDSKLQPPLLVSVSGAVLTVAASTVQRRKSDGSGGQSNSYKSLLSPVGAKTWVSIASSTIDVSSGAVTGDFASPATSYTMTASYYNWMGFSVRVDGKIYVTWGTQAATSGAAVKPIFSSSDYPVAVILVQDDGSSGAWNFSSPTQSDINFLYGQGSGGGGTGAGLGSNLADLPYLTEWEDSFDDDSLTDKSAGYTTAAIDLAKGSYSFNYDSDTVAGWGGVSGVSTTVLLGSAAAYTVAAGDVISAVYTEVSGVAGAGLTGQVLTATTSIFTIAMVGRRIRNTTDATSAYVTAFTSATSVTMDRDVNTWSGDNLAVDSKPSARRITVVASQQSFTIESAFPADLGTAVMVCVSQAFYSKDAATYYDSTTEESVAAALLIRHLDLTGVSGGAPDAVDFRNQAVTPAANDRILALDSGTWRETYVSSVTDANTMVLADTTGMADANAFACVTPQSLYIVNYVDDGLYGSPTVVYQAITGASSAANWAAEYARKRLNNNESTLPEQTLDDTTKAGGHLFVRFFANSLESTAAGVKKLYGYQAWWYREAINAQSGIVQQAYGMTNNIGSTNNVNMTVGVVGGRTRATLTWGYVVGVNPGKPYGELEVRLNAQEVPRYVNATITPGANYTEPSSIAIDFDQDYSAYAFEIGVVVRYGSYDSSNDNASKLSLGYNAIVGTAAGCTHATLAAAITACPAGGRILVNNETFTITGTLATVNKDNITIEGKGRGSLFDGDDSGVGITISNPGCVIKNIKLKDFTTAIDVNAENCMIVQNWFESNVTYDVDVTGITKYIVDNNISE